MPVALKCPSCHAPLPEAPGAAGLKCNYCGTLVQATRYLPSPVLQPPVLQPPPEVPPELAQRIEQLRQGGAPPARRSPVGRMLLSFFIMDVLIGLGIGAYFLLRATDPSSSGSSGSGGAAGRPDGPLTLPVAALEPGTPADVPFPEHSGGPTTAERTFTVPAAGPWQVWYTTSTVARSCTMTLLGPDGGALLGPLEGSNEAWGWAALPAGPAKLRLVCEDSPIPQQLRVAAEPLPRWDGRSPLRLRIAAGVPAAAVVVPLDRDGIWAVQYRGQRLGEFQLLAADGTVVGRGSPSDSATGELTAAAGEYVARFDGPSDAAEIAELSLVHAGPQPLPLGEPLVLRPSAAAPRAHFVVRLAEPLRLAVTVTTGEGSSSVELRDAEGLPVATAEGHPRQSSVTAEAVAELPAGEYRVAVLSHAGGELRVWAHEAGELRLLALDEHALYQRLNGCTCRAEVDAEPGTELVQLAARTTGSAFELLSQSPQFELAWALGVGTLGLLELLPDDTTAPPLQVRGSRVGLGIACQGDTVVLAALDRVTGWSIGRRRRLWTTTFDGVHTRGRGGGADELAINCGRLTLRDGLVSVPLEGGGRAVVRIEDGLLQP